MCKLTSVNVEYSLASEDGGVVGDLSQHPSHPLQSVDWVKGDACLTHYVNHLHCRRYKKKGEREEKERGGGRERGGRYLTCLNEALNSLQGQTEANW